MQCLIALAEEKAAPFWHVVKKAGSVLGRFPGGTARHAALLTENGFVLETTAKTMRVKALGKSLVALG